MGCVPVDAESWLTRNLAGGVTGLAGKNIALVGCGAIGGYLADLLVKSGAGFLGGSLVLIDDDELSVGNLGRHFLGFEYIGQNKAAALCAELRAKYPEVQVSFIPKRVRYET
ncbi:ThiF family adenylyltransferase, partial [Pseudomonas aeruginosa]|uniref:ThiF family adenylyltransferase n=1 Tax=Pseudomonas aeruginosa TaxID=287 RepID=UPI002E783C81